MPKVKIEHLERDSVTETVAQLTAFVACWFFHWERKMTCVDLKRLNFYSSIKLEFYNLDGLAPKLSDVTNFKVKWKFPRDFVEERKLSIDNFPDISFRQTSTRRSFASTRNISLMNTRDIWKEYRLLGDILVYRK